MIAPLFAHPALATGVGVLVLGTLAAEILIYRARGRRYAWREVRVSLGVALVQRAANALSFLALVPLANMLYAHRLWTLPLHGATGVILAFLAVEFAYYWMHRASHRVAWMWATHSVHHSAEQLNLFAAIRLGATGILSFEWLPFAAVIALMGISPTTVGQLLALDLLYQFFLHSELAPRSNTRNWIFNTPSDHRVHHAVNREYLDRNFGGVLIIFDRLFGTYAPERAENPPRYGLLGEVRAASVTGVMFGGWTGLATRLRAARTARSFARIVLGPPAMR